MACLGVFYMVWSQLDDTSYNKSQSDYMEITAINYPFSVGPIYL